jgi:hypothetical protein
MEKMPRLDRNIPQSGRKNQIKLARDQSLYHKATPFCDLSDEIPRLVIFAIDNRNHIITGWYGRIDFDGKFKFFPWLSFSIADRAIT